MENFCHNPYRFLLVTQIVLILCGTKCPHESCRQTVSGQLVVYRLLNGEILFIELFMSALGPRFKIKNKDFLMTILRTFVDDFLTNIVSDSHFCRPFHKIIFYDHFYDHLFLPF